MARMKPQKEETAPMVIHDEHGTVLANYSGEMIDTIKATVAKDATNEELYMFLNISSMYDLNPFMKEIWFAKTEKGQPMIMTSRDGYRKLAMRDKRFVKCHSATVHENDEFETEMNMGDIVSIKHKFSQKDRGQLVGAYAYLKTTDGEDLYVYVNFREYDRRNNIWKKYPSAMIRKVAENDVYKRFVNINGLNDFESMPNEFIDDVAEEEADNSEPLEVIDVDVVTGDLPNNDEPTCFTDLLGYDDEEKAAVEKAKQNLANEMMKEE